MGKLGIDLSLRSTGLCYIDDKGKTEFALINKKEDNEALLYENVLTVEKFMKGKKIDRINLEGLSFNSISSSKDIIAGQFWYLRTELWKAHKEIPLNIVAVLSWRSPLFNKEERAAMKECDGKVKELKRRMRLMDKTEKAAAALENKEYVYGASIKYQTFLKLPKNIQSQILSITSKDSKYDLTDAYFIANHDPKEPKSKIKKK